MSNSIIASIQVIPVGSEEKTLEASRKAVSIIEQSGLHYQHNSLSISIDGSFEQVMSVIEAVRLACFNAGAMELFLNIQIKASNGKDLKLKK